MKALLRSGVCLPLVLVAVFCVVAVPAAVAAEGTASITGKVKDVDLQEKSVVVGSPGGDMVVYIEDGTKITSAGETKSLADISVGMVVKVAYAMAGEDRIAGSVTLLY